jgi:hypothetical protein
MFLQRGANKLGFYFGALVVGHHPLTHVPRCPYPPPISHSVYTSHVMMAPAPACVVPRWIHRYIMSKQSGWRMRRMCTGAPVHHEQTVMNEDAASVCRETPLVVRCGDVGSIALS